jgi:predicted patatin/cPLA2 family phospholipase
MSVSYISIKNLQKTGSLFGFDCIFVEMFHSLLSFDYQTFFNSPTDLKVGATDLKTGQAVFFDKSQLDVKKSLAKIRFYCT